MRSENKANQLVIIRSIKLQMTLTDNDVHQSYIANLSISPKLLFCISQ